MGMGRPQLGFDPFLGMPPPAPFDTQRNDTWSLADMYENYIGKKPKTPGVLDSGESRALVESRAALGTYLAHRQALP